MSSSPSLPPPNYDRSDGLLRPIVFTGVGLVLGLGLVLALSAWVYRNSGSDGMRMNRDGPEFSFKHAPAERTGIERDWTEQNSLVHDHLETYGWVDRQAGVVHIPIARAMERLVRRTPPDAQLKERQ